MSFFDDKVIFIFRWLARLTETRFNGSPQVEYAHNTYTIVVKC